MKAGGNENNKNGIPRKPGQGYLFVLLVVIPAQAGIFKLYRDIRYKIPGRRTAAYAGMTQIRTIK